MTKKNEEEYTVRTFDYQGEVLGKIVSFIDKKEQSFFNKGYRKREFRPSIDEFAAIDLVREMPLADKIHMRHNAYAVHRLLESYGINPDDYVDNEDIMLHIAEQGINNLTKLNHNDKRAWKLVKQRGLEDELNKLF